MDHRLGWMGTCRIREPVGALRRGAEAGLAPVAPYGFLHTATEMLQCLDHAEGLVLPLDLVPLIAGRAEARPLARGAAEAWVVELSSLKEIHFEGWLLQLNHLTQAFRGAPEVLRHALSGRTAAGSEERRRAVEAIEGWDACPALLRRVALGVECRVLDPAALATGIERVSCRLGVGPERLVLVCHVCAPLQGRVPAAREAVRVGVAAAAARLGAGFVDPSPIAARLGFDRALKDEGRDLSHYTDAMVEALAHALDEALPRAA